LCSSDGRKYIDGDEVVGLGSINKEGSGRLRLVASQQKVLKNSAFCCLNLLVAVILGVKLR
jgi:hypothetical protein